MHPRSKVYLNVFSHETTHDECPQMSDVVLRHGEIPPTMSPSPWTERLASQALDGERPSFLTASPNVGTDRFLTNQTIRQPFFEPSCPVDGWRLNCWPVWLLDCRTSERATDRPPGCHPPPRPGGTAHLRLPTQQLGNFTSPETFTSKLTSILTASGNMPSQSNSQTVTQRY